MAQVPTATERNESTPSDLPVAQKVGEMSVSQESRASPIYVLETTTPMGGDAVKVDVMAQP